MKSHKICNFATGPPFTVQKSYFNTVNILTSFKSTMNKLLTFFATVFNRKTQTDPAPCPSSPQENPSGQVGFL